MEKGKTFQMIYLALLVAFAVAIHTVEAALPLPVPIPGVKLGLANIITLFALVLYGYRSGLLVASLRSLIGSFLIGNFLSFGFYLSFGGAVVSSLMMALFLKFYTKKKITLVSVSVAGALTFNVVQLTLAAVLVQNYTLWRGYLPFLLALAVPTGLFTGLAAMYLLRVVGWVGLQAMDSNRQ